MKDIQVDQDGELRCATCGGKHFTEKRTVRAKAAGGGAAVLTFGIAGAAAPLMTKKKLQCKLCGAYNKVGNAQPFEPTTEAARSGVPGPRASVRKDPQPEFKPASKTETMTMLAVLFAGALALLIWAAAGGHIVWAIFGGVVVAAAAFGMFAVGINPDQAAPPRSHQLRPSPAKVASPEPRPQVNPNFTMKQHPPKAD